MNTKYIYSSKTYRQNVPSILKNVLEKAQTEEKEKDHANKTKCLCKDAKLVKNSYIIQQMPTLLHN